MGKKEKVDKMIEKGKEIAALVGNEKATEFIEIVESLKNDIQRLDRFIKETSETTGDEKEERIVQLLEYVEQHSLLPVDAVYLKGKDLGWSDSRALNPLFKPPTNCLTKLFSDGREMVAITESGFRRIRKWRAFHKGDGGQPVSS